MSAAAAAANSQSSYGGGYFDMSAVKCQSGPSQYTIDPKTGQPLNLPPVNQSQSQFARPAKPAASPMTPPQAHPISTEMSKMNFTPATHAPTPPAVEAIAPRAHFSQMPQNLSEESIRAATNQKGYMTAKKEDLDLAFGSMKDNMKTRRFKFSKEFTMHEGQKKPIEIAVSPEAEHIFKLKNPQGGERIGKSETAIILGARLISASSDCPVPIGVKITGIKGNTYTPQGGRYPLVLGHNERLLFPEPGLVIHKVCDILDFERLTRYGHLTMADIRNTVIKVPKYPYSLVHIHSPVITVIERNKAWLKVDISQHQPLDDVYVLETGFVEEILEEIEKFFKKQPFTDLRQFKITLERADRRSWTDLRGVDGLVPTAGSQEASTYALTKLNHFSIWFELDYVLTNVRHPSAESDQETMQRP